MSRYDGGWAPYVPVAERRRRAERAIAKLRKKGHPVAPVTIAGRFIATTFWGRAWCDNMESYRDYASRLPRGRTYVRNGSVVDLQITPGQITGLVSGSELYQVVITIKETATAQWRAICGDCAGGINSLVELLQGRFSNGVMERLCRQESGLFPRPADIRFTCSCPDYAFLCKHVAAVLYGVGARLDHSPELLFRLRAVDETDLVAGIDTALPLSKAAPVAGKVLEAHDLSALFGLDMAEASDTGRTAGQSTRTHTRATTPALQGAAAGTASAAPRTTSSPRNVSKNRSVAARQTSTAPGQTAVKTVVRKQKKVAARDLPSQVLAARQAATARASPKPVVPERQAEDRGQPKSSGQGKTVLQKQQVTARYSRIGDRRARQF